MTVKDAGDPSVTPPPPVIEIPGRDSACAFSSCAFSSCAFSPAFSMHSMASTIGRQRFAMYLSIISRASSPVIAVSPVSSPKAASALFQRFTWADP